MTNQVLASTILEKVGGKENVKSVTHCMTRLRFSLNDIEKANQDELKAMNEIMGVVYKGGQFQLIIGPQVTNLYDEVMQLLPNQDKLQEEHCKIKEPIKKDIKSYINNIMGALAGCMTPLIPILLCMGICKAIVAVLGPQLLGVFTEKDSLYVLFQFVGDAGLYFIPIYVGYTASKKFEFNELMGLVLYSV